MTGPDRAHRLRSPLTALRLECEAALAGPLATRHPELGERFQRMLALVERLERAVDAELAGNGVETVAVAPLDLGVLVAARGRTHAAILPAGRRLQLTPADLPSVTAPEDLLRRVLDLALDAAREAGDGDVLLGGRSVNGYAVVEVGAEEGPGDSHRPDLDGAAALLDSVGGRLDIVALDPLRVAIWLPSDRG